MKILLATSFFPPTHTAGTENYTYSIARGFVKAGHTVQVVCAGRWQEGDDYWNGYTDEVYQGISVRRLHLNWKKAPDPNRYLYDNPIVSGHFAEYLQDLRPDVVHITSCITLSAGVIAKVKEAGIPLIITLTDYWFLCPRVTLLRSDGELCDGQTTAVTCLRCMLREAKVYRWPGRVLSQTQVENLLTTASRHSLLTRWRGLRGMAMDMAERKAILGAALAKADDIIAPSAYLMNVFAHNDIQTSLRVIPYGHDLSWLRSYAGKEPSHLVRIGYMGQIISIKGVHLLVQAFTRLAVNDRAALFIYGDLSKDPCYTQQLRELASTRANIQFEGSFSRERLGEVLSRLDVVVVPSLWFENNPLVIQEAFATKTPVIATNLGGIHEFTQHGVNGLLFERGNVDDLATQLRRVILEPGLLEQLRAGIPQVRGIDEEVCELEQIYQTLFQQRMASAG